MLTGNLTEALKKVKNGARGIVYKDERGVA
jgi:hypothetical protein